MTTVTADQFRLATAPSARTDLRREIILGLGLGCGLFAAAIAWASFAPLDAVASAQGSVRVSGERRVVQTLEGGSISLLPVREGQHVRAGQLLAGFGTASALAQERSLAVRVIGLQAQVALLEAEQAGATSLAEPAAFASLTGEDRVEATRAMALARAEFASDADIDRAENALIANQVKQIDDQIGGFARRQQSSRSQIALNQRELDQVKYLADKGYAPQSHVLALQRSAAGLEGEVGAYQAESARLRNSAGEARLKRVQARQQRIETRAEDLRNAQTQLQAALPQWNAAREALSRTRTVAPVSGTIMALTVFSPGAVAAPGQKLMEIVPDDRSLQIEAKLPAAQADDVHAGQIATIHLAGSHGRNLPRLEAKVTRVSPDSFVDERTGQAFYTLSLRIDDTELKNGFGDPTATVRPGTPVSVQVLLRKRTALQYWLEPLAQTLDGALHER